MNCRAKRSTSFLVTDIATFVVNALAPAEVAKVVIDEDRERIEVVVPDTNNQLSLAIGRRGQNVRLASQLTGWDIDILTEQEESERVRPISRIPRACSWNR
jgi:Transcription elongation factor